VLVIQPLTAKLPRKGVHRNRNFHRFPKTHRKRSVRRLRTPATDMRVGFTARGRKPVKVLRQTRPANLKLRRYVDSSPPPGPPRSFVPTLPGVFRKGDRGDSAPVGRSFRASRLIGPSQQRGMPTTGRALCSGARGQTCRQPFGRWVGGGNRRSGRGYCGAPRTVDIGRFEFCFGGAGSRIGLLRPKTCRRGPKTAWMP